MSKFLGLSAYQEPLAAGYKLLPFRFTPLDDTNYVLTNQVGEFLILDRPTLENLAHHRLSPDEPTYDDLKSKHFLYDASSTVALDLLALKTRTKLRRLREFTGLHIFVVSLRCEHSCPYCQVSRQSDDKLAFDMSRETAEKSLELVFCSPSSGIKIEFQGGEPLLNYPLIKFIVERAESMNATRQRDLQFVIATNLALIDDEILEFCRAHNILISTSLDGPADLHNKNRPRPDHDSYQRAIAGISQARRVLGHDRVSALMTTTKASLGRVQEIIDEYVRQEFTGIFLRTLSPYGFAVKTKWYDAYDSKEWLEFYFDGLDHIIELNRAGRPFVEYYAATILTKMLTPFEPGFVDLRSPAGVGIAAIVYNYNGKVYASDESRMLAEMGDHKFLLGDVHENTYNEIILSDALLTPLEESFAASAPMCADCAFEPYCGSDPVFHYASMGDFVGRKPTSAFCNRNMEIFRHLIARMRHEDDVRRLFTKWANIAC